jgi:hypothetical protein
MKLFKMLVFVAVGSANLTSSTAHAQGVREPTGVRTPDRLKTEEMRNACARLDDRIAWLDEEARKPTSLENQEWLREERSKAKRTQSNINC